MTKLTETPGHDDLGLYRVKEEAHHEMSQRTSTFYDDIVHVLQITKLTVHCQRKYTKYHYGKIRYAVEFESSNE